MDLHVYDEPHIEELVVEYTEQLRCKHVLHAARRAKALSDAQVLMKFYNSTPMDELREFMKAMWIENRIKRDMEYLLDYSPRDDLIEFALLRAYARRDQLDEWRDDTMRNLRDAIDFLLDRIMEPAFLLEPLVAPALAADAFRSAARAALRVFDTAGHGSLEGVRAVELPKPDTPPFHALIASARTNAQSAFHHLIPGSLMVV